MPHGPFTRAVAGRSWQHRVHPGYINELQEALEDTPTIGEVPDAAEIEDIQEGITRVDPGTTGSAGDAYRVGMDGPHFRDPDSVSPLDHGAVGDGTTDDYNAIMNAITRLGSRGGTLDLANKKYFLGTPLSITAPVMVVPGHGSRSGELVFPQGGDGVIFSGIGLSGGGVGPVIISTDDFAGTTAAAGTGHGIKISTASIRLDRCLVRGFGGNGIDIRGASPTNANLGQASQVAAAYNGGHGIYLEGSDANAWLFLNPNTSYNRGRGVYNNGLYNNAFINPHALDNDLTGNEVDFADDGWSSLWMTPYSEGEHKFWIENNSQYGVLIMGGHSAPIVHSNGLANSSYASTLGWHIMRKGAMLTEPRWTTMVTGHQWRWAMESVGTGGIALRSDTLAKDLMVFGQGSGSGSTQVARNGTLGFYGKTPVTQPAANPDTSGASLADLETEVNQLKAMLRSLGLMAT
jgi:hypothetical protein